LILIGMPAVIQSLCFGCFLDTGGIPNPYSNAILAQTSALAYWPLNDAMGPPPLQGSLRGSNS
jgi:hypothetical protein